MPAKVQNLRLIFESRSSATALGADFFKQRGKLTEFSGVFRRKVPFFAGIGNQILQLRFGVIAGFNIHMGKNGWPLVRLDVFPVAAYQR